MNTLLPLILSLASGTPEEATTPSVKADAAPALALFDERVTVTPGRGLTVKTAAATQGRQLGGGVNGHAFKMQADYFSIWGPSTPLGAGRHVARVVLDASF